MTRVNPLPEGLILREETASLPAKERLLALLDSLGEYATPEDRSRAMALILTPGIVFEGLLLAHECPPYKIEPEAAKRVFIQLLRSVYGEYAELGCSIS